MSDNETILDAVAESTTNTAAAIAAGVALGEIKEAPNTDSAPFVVVPEGYTVQRTPTDNTPTRPIADIKLRDTKSFVVAFHKYAAPNSEIYATLQPAKFLAVIDDFYPFSPESGSGNHRDFRIDYTIPLSHEWKAWKEIDGTSLTQESFAKFIENNLPDIVDPNNSELLQKITQFRRTLDGDFTSIQNLDDGSMQYGYRMENKTGQGQLPSALKLMIPVFENDALRPVDVRLRSKLKPENIGGEQRAKLTFTVEIIRPHKVLEAAFKEQWATIETECDRAIFLGSPA